MQGWRQDGKWWKRAFCVSPYAFFRLTLFSDITETKEEREQGKHSLCSMGSHMCADLSADLSLSELVSVGRPPAHTGPWAAALGCICVGPVSSFSWKQQGSSLPWEFPWTANISYLTYAQSKMDLVFWENQTLFIGIHGISFSRLASLSCCSGDFAIVYTVYYHCDSLLFHYRLSDPLSVTVSNVSDICTFHSAAI